MTPVPSIDPWTTTVSFGDGCDDDSFVNVFGHIVDNHYAVRLSFTGPGEDIDVTLEAIVRDELTDDLGIKCRPYNEKTLEYSPEWMWLPIATISGIHIY